MGESRISMVDKRKFKYVVFFVLVILVVAVIILLQAKDSFFTSSYTPRITAGLPAPNIILPVLDGKPIDLMAARGKVVLLNIWATWCSSCREEMPSMERLYGELEGKDFEILAVSVDASGAKAVAPFMKMHNLSFPALLDPQGTINNLYGVTGVPESFIINKEGIVEKVIIGPMDWATPEVMQYFRTLMQRP